MVHAGHVSSGLRQMTIGTRPGVDREHGNSRGKSTRYIPSKVFNLLAVTWQVLGLGTNLICKNKLLDLARQHFGRIAVKEKM